MTAPDLPTTTLPCPDWCSLPTGHGFHGYDPNTGELIRAHGREVTPEHDALAHVSIYQDEHAAGHEGPLFEACPVLIFVDTSPRGDLTGPQARQLAADLLNAADLWDTLDHSMMGQ